MMNLTVWQGWTVTLYAYETRDGYMICVSIHHELPEAERYALLVKDPWGSLVCARPTLQAQNVMSACRFGLREVQRDRDEVRQGRDDLPS